MRQQIKLRSGLTGTAESLHERYGSLESFRYWDETFGIAARLGEDDVDALWDANPTIASSVEPSDLCTVLGDGRQIYADEQQP